MMSEFEEDSPVIRAVDSLQAVGQLFQVCIQAVEQLLAERENLIEQLTRLKEPMHQEVCVKKAELLALYQNKSKTQIECDNLKEEMKLIKKKLFEVTKAHMACKFKLDTSKQVLPQVALVREELESKVQTLSVELAGLKTHSRGEINQMIQRFENNRDTKEILSLSKNRETDLKFQRVLVEQRQELDKYYQPKLERLMKWNKTSVESLQRTKQEIKDLIKELQPLQEQVAKLNTQRKCLVKQLQLLQIKRAEDAVQYQEHQRELEEKVIILRTELAVQTNKNDNIKNLKASLSEDLCVYKERLTIYGNLINSNVRNRCDLKHPTN
ncbi:syncoilin [Callorhinchus milii]|uniref:IF rod domain-containing protein n=1 Tax=Callorhinchus milii TaxID=7868 RepID=A0A4W3IXN5_CALMI|nr:syncoilin [Callorhinchus milii]|eukprot:gi/632972090/ref/XP_007902489.1/ PREDICTED: syncoilin [Callorhinchus milii]